MRRRLTLLLTCTLLLATLLLAALLPGGAGSGPVLAQVPVPPVQERPTGAEGVWAGGYWRDGSWTFIEVTVTRRGRRWTGALSFPYGPGPAREIRLDSVRYEEPARQIELDPVRYEEAALQFHARPESEVLTFRTELSGDSLIGEVQWASEPAAQTATPGTGELHLRRIVLLSRDYDGYGAYVGDYRILPDEAPLFVGRSGLGDALYLAWESRHIGLLPLGGDSFLVTTGHELTFERYHDGEVVGFILTGENPLPGTPEAGFEQGEASDEDAGQARAIKVGHYYTEEVRFSHGSALLAGTVLLPHGPGPHPAVVFAPGAGPETRERYREIAAAFARHGIASIIYDKRGSGASTGKWTTTSLYDLVEGSLGALRVLKPYHEIDHEAIGIWGLSHGGWVAPLAAIWSEEEVAFVITVSGAGMTPAQQDMYRWRNVLLDLGAGRRELDAGLKAARLQQGWNRLNLPGSDAFFQGLNPDHYAISVLERLQPPILAIWGAEDQTVPPWTSAQRFETALARAGNEDVTLGIFPNAGHAMNLVAESESAPAMARGPWVAYPPDYIDLMADWILARTTGAGSAANAAVGTATGSATDSDLPNGMLALDPARADRERLPAPVVPWYGGTAFQFGALLGVALLLLSGVVAWTVLALSRLGKGGSLAREPAPAWAMLAAAAGVLLLTGLLATLAVTLTRFLIVDAAALLDYLRSPVVRGLAWLAPVIALGLGVLAGASWRRRSGTLVARIHLTLVAAAALAVLPLLGYWRLWG